MIQPIWILVTSLLKENPTHNIPDLTQLETLKTHASKS